MKTNMMIVVLIFSLNCLSQNISKQNNINSNVSFATFINKFNELQLPLDINRLNDFDKYGDRDLKEVNGKTVLVPNLLCPLIPVNEYKYIKEKYPTNKDFHYQSVYKKVENRYILLIIEQTNRLTGDYFLELNSYNLSGSLIDTLTLAGQKTDNTDRFCSIDLNLKIKIRTLNFLPDTPNGQLNGFETIEEYIITDDGHFKQTYFNQEKGYFKLKDNEFIRVDKSNG